MIAACQRGVDKQELISHMHQPHKLFVSCGWRARLSKQIPANEFWLDRHDKVLGTRVHSTEALKCISGASPLGGVQPLNILDSAPSTTKAQGDSFEAQRKINHDLDLELTKAAKDAGMQVYIRELPSPAMACRERSSEE